MGNATEPMSMNIAPVPTVSLINKQRSRQSSLVSTDSFLQSQRSIDHNYSGSDPILRERGPSPTSQLAANIATGEPSSIELTDGVGQNELSSSRTSTQPKKQSSPVPAKNVRRCFGVNHASEQSECHINVTPPYPSAHFLEGQVITWVNVDLVMSHNQENQMARETPEQSRCGSAENVSAGKLEYDHTSGHFNVQLNNDFNTGNFTVEQGASLLNQQEPNSIVENFYRYRNSKEDNTNNSCSKLNIEDLTFCSSTLLAPLSENIAPSLCSFGPLQSVPAEASICFNSVHAGDTRSFPVYESHHRNSYDSYNFDSYYPTELCNTHELNRELINYNTRTDISTHSVCSASEEFHFHFCGDGIESSNRASCDQPHVLTTYHLENNGITSLGFTAGQCEENFSFGGGHRMISLSQEGLNSLGFVIQRGRTSSFGETLRNSLNGDSLSAQEAMPKRFGGGSRITSLSQEGLSSLGFWAENGSCGETVQPSILDDSVCAQEALAKLPGGESRLDSNQKDSNSLPFVTDRVRSGSGSNLRNSLKRDYLACTQETLSSLNPQFQASDRKTRSVSTKVEANLSKVLCQSFDHCSASNIPATSSSTKSLNKSVFHQSTSSVSSSNNDSVTPTDKVVKSYFRQASQGGSGRLMEDRQEIYESFGNIQEADPSLPFIRPQSSSGRATSPATRQKSPQSRSESPASRPSSPGKKHTDLEDTNPTIQDVQVKRNEPADINFAEPANDALSIFDGPSGYRQYYSAFLCCAPEDLQHFGLSFHSMLEEWGFKIFLPPRDLVLTGCNFDNMSRALEERCNGKIIVILSVNYEASEECSFLTSFARVLDPDARKRNIIPVQIDKNVEIKNVLKGLSIIRYNHDYKCGWLKQKLVDAIAA
uniref:TIR domain-containing protein n=1 Tax=Biomphalaria glabrata TaxID=6526 RepID=A0A2C9L393_BIOGL